MRELITVAFRQVRGIREICLPEECSPMFVHTVGNLREILSVHDADHIIVEGKRGSFYMKFYNNRWVGVTTESDVNEVLILAALDRTVKFLKRHHQVEQSIDHLQEDIEEFFLAHGVAATVRKVDLAVGSDSLSGEIRLAARAGRAKQIREHMNTFLKRVLPYFIKNNVSIIIEKRSLLDRITRDQLLRIIRRVERL
jgi:hypothetical protein